MRFTEYMFRTEVRIELDKMKRLEFREKDTHIFIGSFKVDYVQSRSLVRILLWLK